MAVAVLTIPALGCRKKTADTPAERADQGVRQANVAEERNETHSDPADDDRADVNGGEENRAAARVNKTEDVASEHAGDADVEPSQLSSDAAARAESSTTSGSEADHRKSSASAPPQLPDDHGCERICLLTDAGPILIDLWLQIDGKPHHRALADLIETSLAMADSDGDGRATWDELTQRDEFRYGRMGTLEIRDEEQRAELIRMYDSDRDGTVDRDELPRFLTRNAGGSRPFHLRSSNFYRERNRLESPIRRLLDDNRDGTISVEERAKAAQALRSRDADQNDILIPVEFRLDSDAPTPPLTRNRTGLPDSAVWISDVRQWTNFRYTLRERYALGGKLRPEHFRMSASLYEYLDEDGDGAIDRDEIERIAAASPQLIVAMRFGESTSSDLHPVELVYAAREFVDSTGHHSSSSRTSGTPARMRFTTDKDEERLTLRWGHSALTLFRSNASEQSTQLSVQFERLDANQDGYLEEAELPADAPGLPAFSALDTDEDEKVFLTEFQAFYSDRQTAWRMQLRCRVGEGSDAFFAALDSNDDGRLTTREIELASARLATFDRDDNGLSLDEIPDSFLLGVVRGAPQDDDQAYQRALDSRAVASANVPDWFASMDRNQDGDISPREFLGDDQQFDRLDQNGDGFIAASEIN